MPPERMRVSNLKHVPCVPRFVQALIYKVLEEMVDDVHETDDSNYARYERMFKQWLQPQTGMRQRSPDETYHIVESLLDVKYPSENSSLQSACLSPWQQPDADAVGTMKVIRVSDVKTGGKHFFAMLRSFLQETARPDALGPAWSGPAPNSSHRHNTRWSLFAVIKDFSQDEAKKLQQNIPPWFLHRRLCQSHPAVKAASEASVIKYALTQLLHRCLGALHPFVLHCIA